MGDEVVLFVRSIIDSRRFAIRTGTDSTVAEFKLLVAEHFDVPVERQRLFYNNRELRDHQTIESYDLQDGHLVYLTRRYFPSTSSGSTSVAAATPLGGNGTANISSKAGSLQNQGFGGGNSASPSSGLDGIVLGSSDGNVPGILINVQYSTETRFAIRARPELTVGEFKGLIAQLQNVHVNEQRLIYGGQFLQDDKTIRSYGVRDDHVIQLVRRHVPATSCTSASVAAPPVGGSSTSEILTGAESQVLEGEAYGLPGFEQPELQIAGNPYTISGVRNVLASQNLLINDPHIVCIIVINNIWIRESTDHEPEFVHILNNPGLRQRMEATMNHEQVREIVRVRIMTSNESLPEGSEGSDMLRQRYENVHEPLLNARHDPWGSSAETRGFLPNNTLRNRAAGANGPGFGGLGIPGLSGLDAQALQHPAAFQIIDEVIHNDLQSSSLVDFNPQVLDALQNPALMSQLGRETWMSQLASGRRLQQSRAFFSSPLGSTPRGTGQNARGAAGIFDGLTAGGAVRPEEVHANHLSLLHRMGFHDNRENLRALIATAGNVRAAVALLLQNRGR